MSNKLVKTLLLLSIIISLIAVGFGLFINQAKNQYAVQLTAVEQSLKEGPSFIQYGGQFKKDLAEPAATIQRSNKIVYNAQQELSEKTNALEETKTNLDTLKEEKEKLQMDLTVAIKEREAFEQNLTETKEKFENTSDELRDLKTALRGRTPKELFDKIDMLEASVRSLERQTKSLTDQLTQVQAKMEVAQTAAEEGSIVPGSFNGKVVSVNKPWSFVVVDIGKNNKLTEGVELSVTRGDASVGKVRVVSVDASTAVADILPDTLQSEIQIGDQVVSIP